MIYAWYSIFTLFFIYNTPLWEILIGCIRKRPIFIKVLIITGDSIYMIGGGVVAAVVYAKGFNLLTMINNVGIILIVTGAAAREYFDFEWR